MKTQGAGAAAILAMALGVGSLAQAREADRHRPSGYEYGRTRAAALQPQRVLYGPAGGSDRWSKRPSDFVIDVVSAEVIGKLPDKNVADAGRTPTP